MLGNVPRMARRGLVALGLATCLAAPAVAAPAGLAGTAPAAAATSADLLLVQEGGSGRHSRRWANSHDDRRWRRHHRRHHSWRRHRDRDVEFGLYLNFGAPVYRYVEPRPVYRYRYNASDAHVAWCYDRWRSYRAWDNTYQPLHGPRRQCWSPYS